MVPGDSLGGIGSLGFRVELWQDVRMDVGEGSRLVAGMGVEIPHDDCVCVLG